MDHGFNSKVEAPRGPLVDVDTYGVLLAKDQVYQRLQDSNILMDQDGKGQPCGWDPETISFFELLFDSVTGQI